MTEAEERELRAAAERSGIHAESTRIYARLASAVRAGADDATLARLLRDEVAARGTAPSVVWKWVVREPGGTGMWCGTDTQPEAMEIARQWEASDFEAEVLPMYVGQPVQWRDG